MSKNLIAFAVLLTLIIASVYLFTDKQTDPPPERVTCPQGQTIIATLPNGYDKNGGPVVIEPFCIPSNLLSPAKEQP